MQKHFIILIIYMVFAVGCDKSWGNEEKNSFINDCLEMKGRESLCFCLLVCLETEYASYKEMLSNIEKIELSQSCRACLEKCE